MRLAIPLVVVVLLVACSSSSTGDTASAPSADAAAQEILSAYCKRLSDCGVKIASVDQCAADRVGGFALNGTCAQADVDGCAQFISILKCDVITSQIEAGGHIAGWRNAVGDVECKRC
jgi:hypothetical protein